MRNLFIQLWLSLIQNLLKVLNNRIFKELFEIKKFLHTLDDIFLVEYCKFRTLNNKLPIEYGKWQNMKRNV